MAKDAFHERLLAIVRKLPEAEEAWPWGSIHCKVAGKIFVGWGRNEAGEMCVGLRTTLDLQSMLVRSDRRFSIAKYSGKYGGIDMRLGKKPDWAEVEQFVVESYRIVAPKRLVKAFDAGRKVAVGAGTPTAARKKKKKKKKKKSSGAAQR
jgi:hypothetical protein